MRDILTRGTLAFVWIYQGLVPKLLRPDTGEVAIFESTGLFGRYAPEAVTALGVAQIAIGILLLVFWKSRAILWINVAALAMLALAMLIFRPGIFLLPFNPLGLLATMVALSAIDPMLYRAEPCKTRNT